MWASEDAYQLSAEFNQTTIFLHLQRALGEHLTVQRIHSGFNDLGAESADNDFAHLVTSLAELSNRIVTYLEMMTERPEDMVSHATSPVRVWKISPLREELELFP